MNLIVTALYDIPVTVKLLTTLALILTINGVWNQLLTGVIAGTLLLAVWCGFPLRSALAVTETRLFSPDNLFLMLIMVLVVWMSLQMSKTGSMQLLVAAVRARFHHRAAMGLLPAAIGMLPMPGGAILRA